MLVIASDHAGFVLKKQIIEELCSQNPNLSITDLGTNSEDSCDYPDFASELARSIENGKFQRGILLCGSANGVAIVANKYPKIRAAIAWLPELATLARVHNDANVLCLPARYLDLGMAMEIVHNFLNTQFAGGRHAGRVAKIINLSKGT